MMLFAFAMVFAACSSDGEVRHLGVTAVKALYEPDNGKAVEPVPSCLLSLDVFLFSVKALSVSVSVPSNPR